MRTITTTLLSVLILMNLDVLAQSKTAEKKDSTKINEKELQEIVITASRTKENSMLAPVSIEKLSLDDIRKSAQLSFFDAIENLKGIVLITPSLGFKVINARGFTNTTNVRFVQMADGVDNQAPHIGAPIANAMGPTDLDILKVEIIPGSASAVYGMNAINGTANFITKNPFDYQGFSFVQKTGVNHISDNEVNAQLFTETNIRYAKSFLKKFAFKLNGAFAQGTDWYADNLTDLNPAANASTNIPGGNQNPGKDLVNIYGDESSDRQTLTMSSNGKQYVVSRTGYAEKYAADYGLKNWKGDASFYYRPAKNIELSYTYRFANLNTVYQRTNRFRFDGYNTQQHIINLKTKSIQFKAYTTIENTGNSYNIRSMSENIDNYFKAAAPWFNDFKTEFNKDINGGQSVANAMADARNYADNGRPQPGTALFNHLIDTLRNINNWNIGAALQVNANLYHAEMQHDLTESLLPALKEQYKLSLMYGLDYRDYSIVPDGNYFINPTSPGSNLNYWKTGGFVEATKFFSGNKLKLNAVLRIDKNQYFDAKFNPRLALVYSPNIHNNFRVAVQNGYRFPSIFEAFSNINSGGVKRVGGLPVMSNGIFENSYLNASIAAFQSAVTTDVNKNGYTANNAIIKEAGLLKKNPYTYIQPEQVSSLELGYRARFFNDKLSLDMDFYYNIYNNLMAQVDANVPKTGKTDSIPFYLNDKTRQDKYRLWTNSKTVSYNYGATAGATYQLPELFQVAGNFTLTKLDRKDQQDGLEDGFNTPDWIFNLSVSNSNLYKNIGFAVNYRQQAAYLWQSSLATGNVDGYSTIDAQINYHFIKNKAAIKLGANNLLNKYYYSYMGGPSVGAFYYTSISWGL